MFNKESKKFFKELQNLKKEFIAHLIQVKIRTDYQLFEFYLPPCGKDFPLKNID